MTPSFSGPRLKIERAKQHISNLHERLVAFSKSNYYALRVEKDHRTGQSVMKFEITKSIPEDCALIVGDAIHNLKSALDFACSDIVLDKTRKWSPYTKFPVRRTRDELLAAVNGGTIRQASKAIADLIVDVIKPYPGGNDAICALHELNILDKHMLLLPVMQVSALLDVCAEDDRGNRMVNATLVIDGTGRAMIPFVTSGNLQIQNYGKPAIQIFFAEGLPMHGEPVIPTLRLFTERVSGIIEAFQTVLT